MASSLTENRSLPWNSLRGLSHLVQDDVVRVHGHGFDAEVVAEAGGEAVRGDDAEAKLLAEQHLEHLHQGRPIGVGAEELELVDRLRGRHEDDALALVDVVGEGVVHELALLLHELQACGGKQTVLRIRESSSKIKIAHAATCVGEWTMAKCAMPPAPNKTVRQFILADCCSAATTAHATGANSGIATPRVHKAYHAVHAHASGDQRPPP